MHSVNKLRRCYITIDIVRVYRSDKVIIIIFVIIITTLLVKHVCVVESFGVGKLKEWSQHIDRAFSLYFSNFDLCCTFHTRLLQTLYITLQVKQKKLFVKVTCILILLLLQAKSQREKTPR